MNKKNQISGGAQFRFLPMSRKYSMKTTMMSTEAVMFPAPNASLNATSVMAREKSHEQKSRTANQLRWKTCDKCNGSGKLRNWKTSEALYGTRHQYYCRDVSECPVFIVQGCGGKSFEPITADAGDDEFHEMAEKCDDPDFPEMGEKIRDFKGRHQEIDDCDHARINKQRYIKTIVKIWEVKYNQGEEEHRFWIIGDEQLGVYDIYWPTKEYSPRCCHCNFSPR